MQMKVENSKQNSKTTQSSQPEPQQQEVQQQQQQQQQEAQPQPQPQQQPQQQQQQKTPILAARGGGGNSSNSSSTSNLHNVGITPGQPQSQSQQQQQQQQQQHHHRRGGSEDVGGGGGGGHSRHGHNNNTDYIVVIEFSEAIGPIPVVTLPRKLPGFIDLKRFGLRVMVSDFRKKKARGTLPTVNVADMNQLFQDFPNHLFIYCHYTAIADFGARGYTRAICLCYVSQTPKKIQQISRQLKQSFEQISLFLKRSAQQVFLKEVRSVIQQLSPLLHQIIPTDVFEPMGEVSKQKKTLKNINMSKEDEMEIETDTEEIIEKDCNTRGHDGDDKNEQEKEGKEKKEGNEAKEGNEGEKHANGEGEGDIRVRCGKKIFYQNAEVEYSDLFQVMLTPENVQDIVQDMQEILLCFESDLQEVYYENPLQSKYIGNKDITCKVMTKNDLHTTGNTEPRMRYRPNRLGHEGYRQFSKIIGGVANYQIFEKQLKQMRTRFSKNVLDIFVDNSNADMTAALDDQRLFVVGQLCCLDIQPGHMYSPSWQNNRQEEDHNDNDDNDDDNDDNDDNNEQQQQRQQNSAEIQDPEQIDINMQTIHQQQLQQQDITLNTDTDIHPQLFTQSKTMPLQLINNDCITPLLRSQDVSEREHKSDTECQEHKDKDMLENLALDKSAKEKENNNIVEESFDDMSSKDNDDDEYHEYTETDNTIESKNTGYIEELPDLPSMPKQELLKLGHSRSMDGKSEKEVGVTKKFFMGKKKHAKHRLPGKFLGGGRSYRPSVERRPSPSPPVSIQESNTSSSMPPNLTTEPFTEPPDAFQSPISINSRSGQRKGTGSTSAISYTHSSSKQRHTHSPGELLRARNVPSSHLRSRAHNSRYHRHQPHHNTTGRKTSNGSLTSSGTEANTRPIDENEEEYTTMPALMKLETISDRGSTQVEKACIQKSLMQTSSAQTIGHIWEEFVLSRTKVTIEVHKSNGRGSGRRRKKEKLNEANAIITTSDNTPSTRSITEKEKIGKSNKRNHTTESNHHNEHRNNGNNDGNNNSNNRQTAIKDGKRSHKSGKGQVIENSTTRTYKPHQHSPTSTCTDADKAVASCARCRDYFETAVEKDLLTILLRRFDGFSESVLFNILINRPIVVLAPSPVNRRTKERVRKIVRALSLLIPGVMNQSSVEEWRSKPLHIHDLSHLKLVGMPSHVYEISAEMLWEWVATIQIKDDKEQEIDDAFKATSHTNTQPHTGEIDETLPDHSIHSKESHHNKNVKEHHTTSTTTATNTVTSHPNHNIPDKVEEQDKFVGTPYRAHSDPSLIYRMLHTSKRFKNDPDLFYRHLSRNLLEMSLDAFLFYWISQSQLSTACDNPLLYYQQLLKNLNFLESQDSDIAKHWCHIMQQQLHQLVIYKRKKNIRNFEEAKDSKKNLTLLQYGSKIPPPIRIRGDVSISWHKNTTKITPPTEKSMTSNLSNRKHKQNESTNTTDKKKKEKSSWLRFWK